MEEINREYLNKKEINSIRDAALSLEKTDVKLAYNLMKIAFKNRPDGPLIKSKLKVYAEKLKKIPVSKSDFKLKEMVDSGNVAIIPIGFRCFTKNFIAHKLKIVQASLPFDSGFFPPESIASVLNNPKINLKFPDINLNNHTVCIKNERYNDSNLGIVTQFKKSTYHEIDSIVDSGNCSKINSYLDSTYGYYTVDLQHKFVLAHYNWHKLSNPFKSKGITDPEKNIENINQILNKRIERMFELCNSAKYIFFIVTVR